MMLMLIISTISKAAFLHVQGTTTSRKVWLSLERAYAPHTSSREYTLKNQLLKLEMKGDETSDAYLNRAKEYPDALANIGEAFKEKDLIMLLIAGLCDDYNGLKSTLLARQAPTAFHELQRLLADHDYMIKQYVPVIPSQTGSSPWVFTTTTFGTSSQTGSSQQDPVQAVTQLASQLEYSLWQQLSANHADYRSQSPAWIFDTGSNGHVAPDSSSIGTSEPYYGEDFLHVSNGKGLPILHIGNTHIHTPNKTLSLTNILHILQIKQHLVSVQQFCHDNNVFFEFHDTFYAMKDETLGTTLLTGPCKHGLYSINLPSSQPVPRSVFTVVRVPIHTWH
ncbi:beta-grasp domain-containing protein [Tanacetum coccineum]|uniref:Beta-grasp domain-containing protein n=1 Tax=Tanacetum coccineum TaxID=301880 RepID=A0ABQ5BD46_9ASTR